MLKLTGIATVFALLSATTAMAACPSIVPGSTAEAIRANELRIICLQTELATATRESEYELRLNKIESSINAINLQRRFDALPKVPIYTPPKF